MDAFDPAFLPVSGFDLPRFAGIPTFMRLPAPKEPAGVEVGLVGVPWDGGTTNRPGARHGPRALRDASTMIRMVNQATAAAPFHTARCADLGDVPPNPASLDDSLARIHRFYEALAAAGVTPLTAGGDHLTSLPVLRALAAADPVGMIHFDSHTDLYDDYFGGYKLTHGTPFRRAVEEGLLDPRRIVQIGIRGTTYDGEDRAFAAEAGIRIVTIEELFDRGTDAVMAEARAIVGDRPVYVSFDIDGIDPAQAPGTGTPEIGGLTTADALAILRGVAGIDVVGGDVVEVAPQYDATSNTAHAGAQMLFEILSLAAIALKARKG